ncbi:U7 snRNA-associated Sm-like protein LSm11 [Rhagoletis pomonella]|uniref:U7 snRNA-associated Sm-like protein LSm11 n=1 Tax=Rhagoletis pomonella TaxID=28610 RepID=UPI0017807755|nr:U7 snRNA-associated Sm-like protein LSm11 [Rhagoletis pomonella]
MPADSELDITSEKFDPLRALYAPGYRISEKKPKVIYQNLAAFESALKRFGIMNLNKRNAPTVNQSIQKEDGGSSTSSVDPSISKQRPIPIIAEETQQRRFQPHQMPIKGSARKVKDMHNIFTYLDGVSGPMKALKHSMKGQRRVRVLVRNEHGIRGSLEGWLIWFDKFWNLWLRNVDEVWQRRKYKYGENKVCGEPRDCSLRLHELGIELPRQQVRSINRKTVEIRRQLPQLFVRGEQVALVILSENVAATETDM